MLISSPIVTISSTTFRNKASVKYDCRLLHAMYKSMKSAIFAEFYTIVKGRKALLCVSIYVWLSHVTLFRGDRIHFVLKLLHLQFFSHCLTNRFPHYKKTAHFALPERIIVGESICWAIEKVDLSLKKEKVERNSPLIPETMTQNIKLTASIQITRDILPVKVALILYILNIIALLWKFTSSLFLIAFVIAV